LTTEPGYAEAKKRLHTIIKTNDSLADFNWKYWKWLAIPCIIILLAFIAIKKMNVFKRGIKPNPTLKYIILIILIIIALTSNATFIG
jgi:uncharacterized membrane protein